MRITFQFIFTTLSCCMRKQTDNEYYNGEPRNLSYSDHTKNYFCAPKLKSVSSSLQLRSEENHVSFCHPLVRKNTKDPPTQVFSIKICSRRGVFNAGKVLEIKSAPLIQHFRDNINV